jgi:hypothetical protein
MSVALDIEAPGEDGYQPTPKKSDLPSWSRGFPGTFA